MTDRVKGFTVTLAEDIRVDDIEAVLNALRMVKGVIHVEPVLNTPDDHFSKQRVKDELRDKFYDFFRETFN